MGRKRKNAMIVDSRLTNCSVVVEILDEVFIPRHEPGFDYNWGNYSWHVATVKKDQGLPSEANEKILDDSISEDSDRVKQISKNRKSCDQCNFKSTKPKFLMRHILTAHSVFGENESDYLDENELVNDDKSDTYTKIKHSNAKKLVIKKKASYKHRLGAKHSTPPKKLTRSNSLMEDRGNNENKCTISPGKKTKSDSVSMKTEKPVLNVHNSSNEVSKPVSDAPKAVKKEIISSDSPPKKIISHSPSITSKGLLKSGLNADNFLVKNEIESSDSEQKKSFSCTKQRKSNSHPIEKKKHRIIGQKNARKHISSNKTNDRQTNKSPFSLPKKRSSDSDSMKVKKGLSDSQNGSIKGKSVSCNDSKIPASAKKRKLDFDSMETEKSKSNSLDEKKVSGKSGHTNKTPHSPPKKKKLGSIEKQKVTSNYEQAIRKSESNLLKEIKSPTPKSTAISETSNLQTIQTQNEMSNYNTVCRSKSKTPITKYMKSGKAKEKETSTVSESSDEDTIYYSFNKFIDKPQNESAAESKNVIAKKKMSYSPCINTDKLNKSDTKKRVSFKESNDEAQPSVTLKRMTESVRNQIIRLPRNLFYPLGCQYCQFRCKSDWVMQKHTLVIHNNGKYFSCKLCNYTTKVMGSFQIHHLIHSNLKPLKCLECDYKTNNVSNLNNHKKCHSDLRPFECDQCSYTCKNNSHLKSHKLIHTDDKQYSCTQCDYKCKKPDRMKLHEKTHSNIKPLKCDHCDYSCKFQNNLNRHMFIHSDERPFSCDSCDKTFKTKPLLKNHKLVHTYTKPYICEKCNFNCNAVQDLKKHLKSHSA